jgi:hypothetical protein
MFSTFPDPESNELDDRDFLPLNKSRPIFSNFSTPLVLDGFDGGFKFEKDISFSLLSTDIGGDPDRPGDKAHWDVALPYPVSELALLITFFIVSFFIFGEDSNDTAV